MGFCFRHNICTCISCISYKCLPINTTIAGKLLNSLIFHDNIKCITVNMWLSLRKSTMWVQKNCQFVPSLLYHNLRIICNNTIKSLSLLQNLKGFFWILWKWHITFRTKDISENITWCNLHSHDWFSQARSHIIYIGADRITWQLFISH